MKIKTIPVKNVCFKKETKKLNTKWLNRSCILHSTMTLILFIVAICYFYICPQSIGAQISAYTSFLILATTPYICFVSYKESDFFLNYFCYWKFIPQLLCMCRIIESLVSVEVIGIIPNTNSKKLLDRDAIIMFFTMIVIHFNTQFFKRVVLAKKRAEVPRLVVMWKKVDKKQDEPLKYEVKNEKADINNPIFINIDNNSNQSNNQMRPIRCFP